MEHSDHDDKFFMLMRVIEREVIELNWMKSKYRTLGDITTHPKNGLMKI
jgi:hypothetical protein